MSTLFPNCKHALDVFLSTFCTCRRRSKNSMPDCNQINGWFSGLTMAVKWSKIARKSSKAWNKKWLIRSKLLQIRTRNLLYLRSVFLFYASMAKWVWIWNESCTATSVCLHMKMYCGQTTKMETDWRTLQWAMANSMKHAHNFNWFDILPDESVL